MFSNSIMTFPIFLYVLSPRFWKEDEEDMSFTSSTIGPILTAY